MVRLDMSEYQERHTVSRLVGAPPGIRRPRGGGPADRGGAPPPVLAAAARRGGEGPPRRLQHPAPGARRRTADRLPGPHGRLQEHRHRDDEQPRFRRAQRRPRRARLRRGRRGGRTGGAPGAGAAAAARALPARSSSTGSTRSSSSAGSPTTSCGRSPTCCWSETRPPAARPGHRRSSSPRRPWTGSPTAATSPSTAPGRCAAPSSARSTMCSPGCCWTVRFGRGRGAGRGGGRRAGVPHHREEGGEKGRARNGGAEAGWTPLGPRETAEGRTSRRRSGPTGGGTNCCKRCGRSGPGCRSSSRFCSPSPYDPALPTWSPPTRTVTGDGPAGARPRPAR